MNENIKTDALNCNEIELLIDEHLEGMTSLKDKRIVDTHIERCSGCSAYLKETSELIKKIDALPKENARLTIAEKNKLWEGIQGKIDSIEKKNLEKESEIGKLSKYKYILSGIAAVIVIAVIIFAVKDMNFSNIEISRTNVIGLPTYWKVSSIQGSPMIDGAPMSTADSIKEGQWIKTDELSRAELLIANIGKVIIEPNSVIKFVKGTDGENRIAVQYGTIDASMNNSSKVFFVEMPSAVAMDQGGSYSMTIDSKGDGLVYVKSGKVEVQSSNSDAIVPAGNLIMTKKNLGAGTPFNENSSLSFKTALLSLDFGQCGDACVSTLLKNAKKTDAITLVNLIPKVNERYKDEVYAKLANYIAPPANVPPDSIPYIDEEEIERWVDKIQTEVEKNVEESIKNMEKSLENLKEIEKFHFDSEMWQKEWTKNWNYDGPKYNKWNDSTFFDKEEFKRDMEKMKEDLKEDLSLDKEEFKKDMQEMKEDLKEMNEDLKDDLKEDFNFNSEEFKKEMEKVKEEVKKAMEDVKRSKKNKHKDSTYYKFDYKDEDINKDNEVLKSLKSLKLLKYRRAKNSFTEKKPLLLNIQMLFKTLPLAANRFAFQCILKIVSEKNNL